jgi:hypothetical protein
LGGPGRLNNEAQEESACGIPHANSAQEGAKKNYIIVNNPCLYRDLRV